MREWPEGWWSKWGVAACWGVMGYVAAWFAISAMCLVRAMSESPSGLPTPATSTMRAVMFAVAVVSAVGGFVWARRRAKKGFAAGIHTWVVWATGALLVMTVPAFVGGVLHERNYLSEVPDDVDKSTALEYGHEACRWLSTRPWGNAPGKTQYLSGTLSYSQLIQPYRPDHPHGSHSAGRQMLFYWLHVQAQTPEKWSQVDLAKSKLVWLAWNDLCPRQLQLHQTLSNSGGD